MIAEYDRKVYAELGLKVAEEKESAKYFILKDALDDKGNAQQIRVVNFVKSNSDGINRRVFRVDVLGSKERLAELMYYHVEDELQIMLCKKLDFLELLVDIIATKEEVHCLRDIAFMFLVENRNTFSFEELEGKLTSNERLKSRFLKHIPTSNTYRFIRKEFLVVFGKMTICKQDLKFEKGVLLKIQDQLFLDSIDYLTILENHTRIMEIQKQNIVAVTGFVNECRYEMAAIQRDRFFQAVKQQVLKCWPRIDEVAVDEINLRTFLTKL